MTWLVALRLVKFLAFGIYAAGLVGAVTRRDPAGRAVAARYVACAGLVGVWWAGWGLMRATGLEASEPWILVSLVLGLVSVEGALQATAGRARLGGALAGGAAIAAVASMVFRSAPHAVWGPAMAVAGLVGAGSGILAATPAAAADDPDEIRTWFLRVARLEGLSLAAMLGIAMPLRGMTGISLDGGTGLLGFAHGALVLLFVRALIDAARALRWSPLRSFAAFASSLVPLGTFVFEAWLARADATARSPA